MAVSQHQFDGFVLAISAPRVNARRLTTPAGLPVLRSIQTMAERVTLAIASEPRAHGVGDAAGPANAGANSPSLRFRGQGALTSVYKPVRGTQSSVDKSAYRAATAAAVGCALLLASLMLLMMSGSLSVQVLVGLDASEAVRRHEIHLKPTVKNTLSESINSEVFLGSQFAKSRNAILWTAFGEWNDELEWEFLRLVAHVTRSPLLNNHDIVLLWETADTRSLPARTPSNSPAIAALLADTEGGRVSLFHAIASDAAQKFPPITFQHGFYYNPEVAAIMFLTKHAGYDFVWLIESDVRWTVCHCSKSCVWVWCGGCGRAPPPAAGGASLLSTPHAVRSWRDMLWCSRRGRRSLFLCYLPRVSGCTRLWAPVWPQ